MNHDRADLGAIHWRPLVLILLGVAAAMLLPLAIWPRGFTWVSNTYGHSYEPFELWGGMTAILAVIIAVRATKRRDLDTLIRVWLPLLVVLQTIGILSEFSQKSRDYNCYEQAAKMVLAGTNPYTDCYIYPPLLAQLFSIVHHGAEAIGTGLGLKLEQYWHLVFYLYQGAQAVALAGVLMLSIRLGRRAGLSHNHAAIAASLLLCFNNPMLRTLRHNQINLWVLLLLLLAIELVSRKPLWAGIALALSIHIKLLPGVLLLPWVLERRWRAVGGTAFGMVLVITVQIFGFGGLEHWRNFFHFMAEFPPAYAFRDNSPQTIAHHLVTLPLAPLHLEPVPLQVISSIARMAAGIGCAIWIGARFHRRWVHRSDDNSSGGRASAQNLQDALALPLLVSPMVWEHHYVFAVPVVLLALTLEGPKSRIIAGAVLMFALPTFDLFPLSVHRLVGLLLVLTAHSVRSVASIPPPHRGDPSHPESRPQDTTH